MGTLTQLKNEMDLTLTDVQSRCIRLLRDDYIALSSDGKAGPQTFSQQTLRVLKRKDVLRQKDNGHWTLTDRARTILEPDHNYERYE